MLVRERGVDHEGVTIAPARWMIVIDLATGDFSKSPREAQAGVR